METLQLAGEGAKNKQEKANYKKKQWLIWRLSKTEL